MKNFKRLLSLILIVVFSLSMASIPAFAADGVIVGDASIYLPKEGAVKLPYVLTTDGTTRVEGAVYSVSVDGVEAAETSKYAEFDSEGYLYVGQIARGKALNLSASGTVDSTDYTASLTVNVSNTIYAEDFEDETVGQTVASEIFDTKTATVITEGEMLVPSDSSNTNKIAQSYTNTSSWSDSQTGLIINGNFESSKLTIEAKVGAQNPSDIDGDFPNMNHPVRLTYESGGVYTKFEGTNGVNYILRKRSGDGWAAGIYTTGYSYYNLMPVKMVITDNTTLDVYVGEKSMTYDISSVKGTDTVLQSIAFGSFVDDIEIYSGEKAVSPYEITGQDTICRAPANTTAKFTYTAAPAIECAPSGEAVTLALKEAYTGVSISGNEVKVAGSADAGTFTLQAKDADGNVLGEGEITIVEEMYAYAINKDRAYIDFELQTAGTEPQNRTIQTNRDDTIFIISTRTSTFGGETIAPVVCSDGDGNKYVSARGYRNYSDKGSNFKVNVRDIPETYKLSGAKAGTLEADFKLNLELMQSVKEHYSLFYITDDTNARIDLRYSELADGSMGIYNYMAADGTVSDAGSLIAVVPADTWFNLRVEADFVDKTYDLYIDNRLVICGEKHTMPYIENIYVGADVDNIAMYHGSKDAAIAYYGSVFEGTSVGIKGQYGVEPSESKTVTFNLSEEVGTITADTSLIVAHYSGGALAAVSIVPVKVTGGRALACAAVTGEFLAGDYVKAFLWNLDTLTPIR